MTYISRYVEASQIVSGKDGIFMWAKKNVTRNLEQVIVVFAAVSVSQANDY